MQKKILTPEEKLCMQYAGMKSSQIVCRNFDEEDLEEAFELYIDKAEGVIAAQRKRGIETITFQEKTFPLPLKQIGADCPAIVHCLGDLSLLSTSESRIAIIGARAASSAGNKRAYELSRKFSEEGNVIVSGLALGCDKSAHEGCLDAGGKTIAIVASGLNIVHPQENTPLQQRILDNGGLILSEHPFGIKANPTRLVARNRLQAALSKAVVLAECPQQSGSMHTMRFARKYHKQCFVASYPIYSDINSGNELLLMQNLAQSI